MAMNRNDAEAALPPPEYEAPPREYLLHTAPEEAPPPPEYGHGAAPVPADESKKKRRLREILALPAILLLGFLFLHALGSAAAEDPGGKAPGLPVDQPPSGIVLDLLSAGEADGEARYRYRVTSGAGDALFPVSVYAEITDGQGNSVRPEGDPDLWREEADAVERAVDVKGLSGDLTLTLTAVYQAGGKEEHIAVSKVLPHTAGAPAVFAFLEVLADRSVHLTVDFIPAADDRSEYDLSLKSAKLEWKDETGVLLGVTELDPADALLGQTETPGFRFTLAGGDGTDGLYPEAFTVTGLVTLSDAASGLDYDAVTEPAELPKAEAGYPLSDGTILLTVFNDTTVYDVPSPVATDEGLTVLASEEIAERDFTGYVLPDPIVPSGYTFAGWVVHVGNPFDDGSGSDLFREYNGDPPVELLVSGSGFVFPVGSTLTPEDAALVPPDDDGVRHICVHAVWILSDPTDLRLFLDDGNGNVTGYGMDVPLASEGYLYLCRYPVPERDGFVFDGWYDADGNRVDVLVCYFSFTPILRDSEGNFAGYDWSRSESVTLTARWKPAS